jgi:hypothetical protein
MNSLEQNLLLTRLTTRLIKQRVEILRSKEPLRLTEECFAVTGKWVDKVFNIEITKIGGDCGKNS